MTRQTKETPAQFTSPTIRPKMLAECRADFRLNQVGPQALSLAELLTIVMGKGTADPSMYRKAQDLLDEAGDLAAIANMTAAELQDLAISATERTRILAAFELGRRHITVNPTARVQVRAPADVANLLILEMGALEQEELRVVLLDTKNYIVRIVTVYKGNVNTAIVRVGELFRDAIRHNAASIIVVHNHPSGDPTPSPEDVRVTEMVVEAGKLNDIAVLDHLIFARNRYVSLKDRGLGFR